jgi:hypothetical protein
MTMSPSYSPRPIPSPNIRVRRTVAILVDVGYLAAQAAFALTGQPARGAVTLGGHGVDAVHALLRAANDEGLEVLRVYWYDGAINLIPGHGHRVLGQTPKVKLRLGNMRDGKQKGVDRLIQRDLTALSAHKAVTDIVLVSGDADLLEEFDDAGQFGLTMHLWGVATEQGCHSQAGSLLRVTDVHRLFDTDWVRTFATVKETPLEPTECSSGEEDEPGVERDEPVDPPVPDSTPQDLPSPDPSLTVSADPESELSPAPQVPHPTPRPKRPLQVVPPQRSADNTQVAYVSASGDLAGTSPASGLAREDYLNAGRTAFAALAKQFGNRLGDIVVTMRAQRRSVGDSAVLPSYLDAALLSACERILHLDLMDDANGRIWVRDGLWSAIDAA